MAVKLTSFSAPTLLLECKTVATGKMQDWSVEVSEVASCVKCVLRGKDHKVRTLPFSYTCGGTIYLDVVCFVLRV